MFRNVWKVVSCGRRNTFATFSQDKLQFSWQAQHFGGHNRDFARQAVARFARIALSGLREVVTRIPWQAWRFARCAEN